MGKINYTKTVEQLVKLELYFTSHRGRYKSNQIKELSLQIGLTRQRVYKWLWDRRNIQRRKVKIQYEDTCPKESVPMTFVKYENYSLKIPQRKEQAYRFDVNKSVSLWARKVLYQHGWQLVRDPPVNNPTFRPNNQTHIQSFTFVTKEEEDDFYDYKFGKTIKKPTTGERNCKKDAEITAKKKKRVTWDLQEESQVQVKEEQSIFYSD